MVGGEVAEIKAISAHLAGAELGNSKGDLINEDNTKIRTVSI